MKRLILIRHAERHEINPITVGNEISLTKKGQNDALLFGTCLKSEIISMRSSPIHRCIQTAKLIGESTGFNINNIELDKDLGDPGFIINDGDLAWEHWQTKGHDVVNQHLLSGTENWDGFANLEYASISFLNTIASTLKTSPSGTHIWVTHDTILATFVSRIVLKPLTIDQWPNFLSYVEIILNADKLEMTYFSNQDFQLI